MSTRDFPALGFDPAPGDLDGITDLAGKYRAVSEDLTEADDSLRQIVRKQGIWQGEASEAFARRIGPLPQYLEGAARSMGSAADALESWSHDLGDLQKRAADLEARAEAAAKAAEAARANPDLALANRTFPDQQSLRIAQRLLDNAGQQLQTAIDGCQNVQDAAKQLQQEHAESASRVAEALRKAKELAPQEPDVLDKLSDAVGGALVDLSNTLADGVDQAWDFVQDHAELISKLSDVMGDIGNGLGILSDFTPPPADKIMSGIATGLGLGALTGHAVAKAAGADVSTETLTFDALGAATSLAGIADVLPDTAIKVVSYSLLTEQGIGEVLGGKNFESPWDDFQNYWVPKDAGQAVMAGGTLFVGPAAWAGVAVVNAADAGVQADNAPARRRERAEDEVWN
ncbi:WXG100 family type VII secretion target [Amycolatopsis kentuckyensis]|uniref:WXG100 family type VII secretion target n=1 Tax=Amycolatopsis kentuckyensis TaxID=218823 RepID=UPI00356563A6